MGFVLFALPVAALAGFAVLLFLTLTRPSSPLCVRRRVEVKAPESEPRTPRDTSRTYPRPGRTRSKLTRVCPVCGMEDSGRLDGKVLGWPAHWSCAEWLGDWRPARPTPPPFRPDPELAGHMDRGQPGCTNTIIFTGKGPVVAGGGGAGGSSQSTFTSGQVEVSAMMAAGLISLDEARERIASAFSVPPPALGATWSVAGDSQPLITGCFACGPADPDCPHRG